MSQAIYLTPTSGPGSGTVTSISAANAAITLTPNPITTTGTIGLTETDLTTTDGTVYWTGTLLATTATGTSGEILTSNGVGMAPSYQAPAASSISITGDTGGALVGNAFTFTGGATGLTFSGAVSTETLGGTLVVSNGGTGAGTFTSHGVLLGNTTSAITSTAAGTTGQVLTGVTGSAPTFQSPAASSISITGDSGGALVGNAFTFTGGSTGLTFSGSGSTETIGGDLVVSNGGTGRTTLTNHGVLVGAGTSAITQLAVGTTGQVLTGVTGSDPVFASPAASSITITGDTGGGLTGNSFTFTGGTTGLKFGGSGTTETVSGTLAIANGGTNATSMTNTDGVVYYDGTRLVTTTVGTATNVLTSNGAGVAPTFQAIPASGVTSISGTANQITASASTGAVTLSTPSTFIAPGSIAATTTVTATSGNITATSGNFVLTAATTSSVGQITQAGTPLIHTYGGITNNFFAGGSGNFTSTATAAVGIGYRSLSGISTGSNSVAIGYQALGQNALTGTNNVAVGYEALTFATSGVNNVGVGSYALGQNTLTGNSNVAVGYQALTFATSSGNNVAIGSSAMAAGTVSGANNVAVGFSALGGIIGGNWNCCFGAYAGNNYTGSEDSNIIIGYNNQGTTSESNVLRIGNATGTGGGNLNTAYIYGIFGNTVGVSGIPVVIDSTSLLGTVVSSVKYKENILPMSFISDDIHKLRPVVFNYKKDEHKSMCYGLIAEEVEEVMPNIVVKDEQGETNTVKYLDLIPMLLNEVQKLRKELNELKEARNGNNK